MGELDHCPYPLVGPAAAAAVTVPLLAAYTGVPIGAPKSVPACSPQRKRLKPVHHLSIAAAKDPAPGTGAGDADPPPPQRRPPASPPVPRPAPRAGVLSTALPSPSP
ncbi:MAG: hypothetical protein M3524_10105, partial [Actinomycetota bacterium]|nr:hypothetical protein [Actinomycetota bacterium]